MSKKPKSTLSSALKAAGSPFPEMPATPNKNASAPGQGFGPSMSGKPAYRTGKRNIAGWFDLAVSRQLKSIGLENGELGVQDLLREAINDLFVKYGKPPIA
jgi:antitoxin-like ribbon-helix-helix protein